ncbi:MAG: enoyl-CoA hydratase-related protein [Vicinamibacterales bacterium]
MSNQTVLWEIDGRGVATVRFNRPEVNNAYNGDMLDGLRAAFEVFADRSAVRVVVLRGNGRHFQAGADLRWLTEVRGGDESANVAGSRRTAEAVRDLTLFPKPVLALVHGACHGGGVGVIAACDVAIASEDAVFSIPEVRWGLAADIIVPQLNAAIGARQVRRFAMTCERFGAATAKAIGLVHDVCPVGQLDAAATPVIEGLLHASPEALAQTKRTILEEAGLRFEPARFDFLVRAHAAKRMSAEAGEGLASFAERREPAWYPGPPARE